ncbi:MAG: hypothetical protein F6K29_34440, partial [Okeania sp. SIO2G5]|nr:hypothetical protein [Okeania sp. SIO2G5]
MPIDHGPNCTYAPLPYTPLPYTPLPYAPSPLDRTKYLPIVSHVLLMAQVSLNELIQAGQEGDRLLSFPTDTVPALACTPESAAMIYAAKQRSQTKP